MKATTRMERQRGSFTAGLPLEPTKPDPTKSTSRRAGCVNHPQNRLVTIIEFVLPGPLFPMPVKITHFSGLSKQIRRFLEKVSYSVGIAHFPPFSMGYTINRQLSYLAASATMLGHCFRRFAQSNLILARHPHARPRDQHINGRHHK